MPALTNNERAFLEDLLVMSRGYVLDFTNSSFASFVRTSTGEEIYSSAYEGQGPSKANRLRAFWDAASPSQIGTLLDDLFKKMVDDEKAKSDGLKAAMVERIISRLQAQANTQGIPPTARQPLPLNSGRVFVSYSVERKEAGGAVKAYLQEFGFKCFLAHEDLQVSQEWKTRILSELAAADIFVALLSKEYLSSKWCDQELGYIVSRPDTLIIPLSLDGIMPHGFISHIQGKRIDKHTLKTVLEEVLFRERPRQVIPTQIEKVGKAGSFRTAEARVRPLVPHFASFTKDEIEAFARAVAENSEVWDAGRCASEYIPEFARVNGSQLNPSTAELLLSVLPELEIPGPGTNSE